MARYYNDQNIAYNDFLKGFNDAEGADWDENWTDRLNHLNLMIHSDYNYALGYAYGMKLRYQIHQAMSTPVSSPDVLQMKIAELKVNSNLEVQKLINLSAECYGDPTRCDTQLILRWDHLGPIPSEQRYRYTSGWSISFYFYELYQAARKVDSPIVLDLDGDGIETVGVDDSSTFFDFDGDGRLHLTGWLSGDDGFLVFDRNADGIINDGGELFGNHTLKYNGGMCKDGFEALAQEDSNYDGILNDAEGLFEQI